MSSHPDADAFVAAILRDPAEVTTRLAFADWLEKTGDPPNVAWAHFIRLSVEAERCPPGVRKEDVITDAHKHLKRVRARLAVPAQILLKHYTTLQQFLPFDRLFVRLGGFTPDDFTANVVTEELARVYRLLPLGFTRSEVLVAIEGINRPAVTDLASLLGVPLLAVTAEAGEIEDAINRTYPIPTPRRVTSAIR